MKCPTKNSSARKRVKAKLMYVSANDVLVDTRLIVSKSSNLLHPVPFFLLAADAQSIEEMVEMGAQAIFEVNYHPRNIPASLLPLRAPLPTWKQLVTESPENVVVKNCRAKSRAALASLNLIAPPKQKGGK